jgi:hypothetical protein
MPPKSKVPPELAAVSTKDIAMWVTGGTVEVICGSFQRAGVPPKYITKLADAFKVAIARVGNEKKPERSTVVFPTDGDTISIVASFTPPSAGAYTHSVKYDGESIMSGTVWVCATEAERDVVGQLLSGITFSFNTDMYAYVAGSNIDGPKRMRPTHFTQGQNSQEVLRCAVRLPHQFDEARIATYNQSTVAKALTHSALSKTALTLSSENKLMRRIEIGRDLKAQVPLVVNNVSVQRAAPSSSPYILAEWVVVAKPTTAASVTYALSHDATTFATGGIFIGPTPTLLVMCTDASASAVAKRYIGIPANGITGPTIELKVPGGSLGFKDKEMRAVESLYYEKGVHSVHLIDHAPCTANDDMDNRETKYLSLQHTVCDQIKQKLGISADVVFLSEDGTISELKARMKSGAVVNADGTVVCAYPDDTMSPTDEAIDTVASALAKLSARRPGPQSEALFVTSQSSKYAISVRDVLVELFIAARALHQQAAVRPLAHALLGLQLSDPSARDISDTIIARGVLPPFGTFIVMPSSQVAIQVVVSSDVSVTITITFTEAKPAPPDPPPTPEPTEPPPPGELAGYEFAGCEWMKDDVGLEWLQYAGLNDAYAEDFKKWASLCKSNEAAWCYTPKSDILFNEHALTKLAKAGWRLPTIQEQQAALDEAGGDRLTLTSKLGMKPVEHLRQVDGAFEWGGTAKCWWGTIPEGGFGVLHQIDSTEVTIKEWTREMLHYGMPGFSVRLVVDTGSINAEKLARDAVRSIYFGNGALTLPPSATAATFAVRYLTDVSSQFRLATYNKLKIAMDTVDLDNALSLAMHPAAYRNLNGASVRYEEEVAEKWNKAMMALNQYEAAFSNVTKDRQAASEAFMHVVTGDTLKYLEERWGAGFSESTQLSEALASYAAAGKLLGPFTTIGTEEYNTALAVVKSAISSTQDKQSAARIVSAYNKESPNRTLVRKKNTIATAMRDALADPWERAPQRFGEQVYGGRGSMSYTGRGGRGGRGASVPRFGLGFLKNAIDTVPDMTRVLDAADTIHALYRILFRVRCTELILQTTYRARDYHTLVEYAASVVSAITSTLHLVNLVVKSDPLATSLLNSIKYASMYSWLSLFRMREAYDLYCVERAPHDASYDTADWPALSEEIGTKELNKRIARVAKFTTNAADAIRWLRIQDARGWGTYRDRIDIIQRQMPEGFLQPGSPTFVNTELIAEQTADNAGLIAESAAYKAKLSALKQEVEYIDTMPQESSQYIELKRHIDDLIRFYDFWTDALDKKLATLEGPEEGAAEGAEHPEGDDIQKGTCAVS